MLHIMWNIFLGFVLLYLTLFILTLIVTNGYKLYLKYKKYIEQKEKDLKIRPQNIQKPINTKKKTWNNVLGCYEIED